MRELTPPYLIDYDDNQIDIDELRRDVTDKLGEPLSKREGECYWFIDDSGPYPLRAFDIGKGLYGDVDDPELIKDNATAVRELIHRVSLKLGFESIITIPLEAWSHGYVTRRAYIEEVVSARELAN